MSLQANYKALQSLFVKGLITYPRSNSSSVSKESIDILKTFAKNNNFSFNAIQQDNVSVDEFSKLAHEAPTLTLSGANLLKKNKDSDASTPTTELIVLECLALLQIKAFVPKQTKTLSFSKDLVQSLPEHLSWVADMQWQQIKWDNNFINDFMFQWATINDGPVINYTPEQTLFETMVKYELGTPATKTANIERLQKLELYDDGFVLNSKGQRYYSKLSPEHTVSNVKKSEDYLADIRTKQRQQEQQRQQEAEVIAGPVKKIIGEKQTYSVMHGM